MKRLIWIADRAFRRHSALLLVLGVGLLIVLALSLSLRSASSSLGRKDFEVAQQLKALRQSNMPSGPARSEPLSVPGMKQRFDITRRILATLDKAGLQPERIRFKFEAEADAGLTRQLVVFSIEAPWSEIGRGLNLLQATDRSIYISKLRIARESAESGSVVADVQLSVVFSGNE